MLEEEHCQESDIVSLGNAMDSCLQPVDLFNELSVEDIESISIVPAEGNKPASLFHEPLIEAKSFPSLFPNGDHTYDAERDDSIYLDVIIIKRAFSLLILDLLLIQAIYSLLSMRMNAKNYF